MQREIVPGTSVTVSYFRRDYKNLIWSDNLGIDPSDYTPFTVPNPIAATRSRIYNLNPAKASALNLLDANSSTQLPQVQRRRRELQQPDARDSRCSAASAWGTRCRTPARSRTRTSSAVLRSGRSYGIPYYTQVKLNGQLRAAVGAAGQRHASRAIPGDARNSTVDGTTALNNGTILAEDPSLRTVWSVDRTTFRTLTGQTLTQSSVNVPLNAPGTKFLDRQNQLDIRLTRSFRFRGLNR